jgi:hypothetical protein
MERFGRSRQGQSGSLELTRGSTELVLDVQDREWNHPPISLPHPETSTLELCSIDGKARSREEVYRTLNKILYNHVL